MTPETGAAKTPHNFLLHLRIAAPELARLFDNILTMGLAGDTLGVKFDTGRWPGSEALSRLDERGALIGSEDSVEGAEIDRVLRESPGRALGTNLGNLFRKALDERERG